MPPLGREAAPIPAIAILLKVSGFWFYDCFAAERGGAAIRQAPRHNSISGHRYFTTSAEPPQSPPQPTPPTD
ncbi:hypothetical protein C1X65_12665 [Pseudomonas sp. FW305-70]|nr:hypothetical protein C1X65_12665 [Pseudomonas sp. FW305-70]